MTVAPAKSEGGKCICLKCMYVKRGSLKDLKQNEFLQLKRKNPALADKNFVCIQSWGGWLVGMGWVYNSYDIT